MQNVYNAALVTELDCLGAVTTWRGHLATNEGLAAQASNSSEERFDKGDFKEAFAEIVIEAQDARNHIAEQLLKDERIFGVMQGMVAKMVWQGFQQGVNR